MSCVIYVHVQKLLRKFSALVFWVIFHLSTRFSAGEAQNRAFLTLYSPTSWFATNNAQEAFISSQVLPAGKTATVGPELRAVAGRPGKNLRYLIPQETPC